MARIIVLAVRNWELRDEKTGEIRTGVKVEGSESEISNESDYRGAGAVEYPGTPEAWATFRDAPLPGIFDCEIGLQKVKAKNGASVARAMILSAKPVSAIALHPAAKAAA